MRTKSIIISILSAISATGLATAEPGKKDQTAEIQLGKSATPAELTATHCLACHGDGVAGQPRLAPPFLMVKMHYQSLDQDAFIKTVSSWIKTPDAHKSKMPGAVRRFGVMPALPLPEAQVAAIAKYVYETDFKMPGQGGKGMGQGGGCCNSCKVPAANTEAPACEACQKAKAPAVKAKAPACEACQKTGAPKVKAPACKSCNPKGDAPAPVEKSTKASAP